jgi:hypothetical protein
MPLPFDPGSPPAVTQADAALSYIDTVLPGIQAISAMLNQRYRTNGKLYDCMDIGWRIEASLVRDFVARVPSAAPVLAAPAATSTTYYVHPDAHKDWPVIAIDEIILKASKVLSIFAGERVRQNLPSPT